MSVVIENNKYLVRVHWHSYSQNWNDICAYAVESFGLPGDKFSTVVNHEYMDFIFCDEKDAIVFSLAVL